MDQCSGDSASYRASGGADPGWTAIPFVQDGRLERRNAGYLRISSASALHVEAGRELSPTLSRSLGTNNPQLEPPKALPTKGRAGAGS